jgi:hypothetical protein
MRIVALVLSFLALNGAALAQEGQGANLRLAWTPDKFMPVVRNYTPAPRNDVAHQCGPPNCCSHPQCHRIYASEWLPEIGRCTGCAVR